MKAKNSKDNLCDSCELKGQIPECFNDDLEFGDGRGNDNIIECKNYIGDDDAIQKS